MARLSDRAFEILSNEVKRLASSPLEQTRRSIVLRRLEKFRLQEGPPLSEAEIREAVIDIFPEFSAQAIKQAAKANQRASQTRKLGWAGTTAVGLAALMGGVWVLNLPYPMIRWPVSRVAPIILLPSFMRMDHSYRQTVSLVEQADQLINQATSPQDIELGAEKVESAQKHLDRLPVWFLGYYPQTYCTLFSCTWRFTYDEFEGARKSVGRMEAQVFQETNAQTLLAEGVAEVEAAKQAHATSTTLQAEDTALANWQAGMDKLAEIAPETYAGKSAQTKLQAYERDYQEVAGVAAGGTRANTLMDAALSFATQAATQSQNPPHSAETWNRIAGLWQQAIQRLEQIPVEDPGYIQAQQKIAEYQNNLGITQENAISEQASITALQTAKQKTERLLGIESMTATEIAQEVQSIINELDRVKPNTTAYAEAQEIRQFALQKRDQVLAQ
ncbi:MAG: hypothetical protein AAFX95_27735 [Cyanobacteria bacterium J06639_16]